MKALWTLTRVVVLTAIAFFLSLSPATSWWLIGQVLLAVSIFQWFVLLHDFGHETFFQSKWANLVGGYVASVFCLLPFTPWKLMHERHHAAESFEDDPTMQSGQKNPGEGWLYFCWRFGIPVYALRYSLKNFWAIKKLWRLFPERHLRVQLVCSFLMMQAFFLGIRPMIPDFPRTWILGYVLFLVMVDALLSSQHSSLYSGPYVRRWRFPVWFSRYVLLNYNHHVEHYAQSTVPSYLLK